MFSTYGASNMADCLCSDIFGSFSNMMIGY